MLPPPDFEALSERLEHGRRVGNPPLLFLGRGCGRLAGSPDLEELARQALALLEPTRQPVQPESVIDPERLRELQRAFLSAFPSAAALEQMLAYGLNVRLSDLVSSKSVTEGVQQVLAWAAKEGQLDALLAAAAVYNPGNAALKAVVSRDQGQPPAASVGLLEEFRRRLSELSSLERYSLLQTIYRRIPVPSFYQDLARLVKAGFVRHILTTNIDSLFEQALEGLGLSRDVDFDLVTLGTQTSRETLAGLETSPDTPLVIKLHGDITQGEFGVSPAEIDYAVHTAKRFIKGELEGDLLIVGYEGESGPLNDWLARASGEAWWVDAVLAPGVNLPPRSRFVPLSPADFFPAVAARLLTLRAPVTPRAPVTRSRGLAPPPAPAAVPAAAAAPAEDQLLAQEIERLKAEVRTLETTAAATGTALQRQEQTTQRRQRIRELEDQLRALPETRSRVLKVLDRIEQAIRDARHAADAARLEEKTADYFTAQLGTLRDEYHKPAVNAHVVAAALGATLVLAERLGPTVIDPQDARTLSALGPTLSGRS